MKIHGVCDFFSRVGEDFLVAGRAILNTTQRVAIAILGCPLKVARGCFLAGRAVLGCARRAVRATSQRVENLFFSIFAPRELREYNQQIQTILSKLKNDSFSQEETFNQLIKTANSSIILPEQSIRPIQETFSSLLDRGGFTVHHTLEEIQIFPRKWEGEKLKENNKAKAAAERIIPLPFWTKTTSDNGLSFEQSIESEEIQALTEFYKNKPGVSPEVSDAEDLVYHLMLRLAPDYAGIASLCYLRVFAKERVDSLVSGDDFEGNGYHFGFENGIATAYQIGIYKRINPQGEVLQQLEITRSISADPTNLSSAWDEVVTIRKLEE
jgi:hypothetical protein